MSLGLRCTALSILLTIPWSARAEGPSHQPDDQPNQLPKVTLAEALSYAKSHQPAIRAALARVAAARADADVPRAQWSPVVGVTGQIFAATANNTTASYVGPAVVDIPRIGGTRVTSGGSLRPYASTLVGVGGAQELFDFGRIAAQAAAYDARIDVERERAKADRLDVTFDVEEAYFAVFSAKEIERASEEAYERAKAHRDLANAGVSAGLRSPIELTRAEADLSRFDIGRLRTRGGVAIAQSVLAAAVGVPDPALDIAEAPPAPAEMPSLPAAIDHGSAAAPAILEALAELRAQEAATRAIAAESRPDVSLTATVSGRAGGAPPSGNGSADNYAGLLPNVPNWDVGIVLSWPLFDATISARKAASKVREGVRTEQVSLARQRAVAAIREAYVTVDVARTALPGLKRSVDAAHANYEQADARFKSGLGTSVELADAEAIRTEAEIQLALGEFELARARAAFGRSIAEGM